MEKTESKIIVFGDYEQRFEIPKTNAVEVNGNLVIDMNWSEFVSHKIDVTTHNI